MSWRQITMESDGTIGSQPIRTPIAWGKQFRLIIDLPDLKVYVSDSTIYIPILIYTKENP